MTITRGKVFQNTSFTLFSRIVDSAGNYITQSEISSIDILSYDMNAGQILNTGTIPVDSTVFDSLQTSDPRYVKDEIGFNCAAFIDGSFVPNGDTLTRIQVSYTTITGDVIEDVSELEVITLYNNT